jgi:hypothetical protein
LEERCFNLSTTNIYIGRTDNIDGKYFIKLKEKENNNPLLLEVSKEWRIDDLKEIYTYVKNLKGEKIHIHYIGKDSLLD